MPKKTGLGMGLAALFEDNPGESRNSMTARISEIEPNKAQPRRNFDEDSISVLAESIRRHGLVQPILVRPLETGGYRIVAGERRYRACKLLEMTEIPILVMELSDREAAQITLIENIQREDLNPLEEAAGYRELMDEYGMTQEEVSDAVGKSRPTVANMVRLLKLPAPITDMLRDGTLSAGQAKAVAGAKTEHEMIELARRASDGGLTVRAIERLVSSPAQTPAKAADARKGSGKYLTEMEISLRESLRRQIKISSRDGVKGNLTIAFFDSDDLSALAERLSRR